MTIRILRTALALMPLTLALALATCAPAFAAGEKHHTHANAHTHAPQHGGVVVEMKAIDYELVATPGRLQLHLRAHGTATDLAKASARLTLLKGSTKQDVTLQPAGNTLEATGSFLVGPGTKVVALVTIDGKPAGTVRFVLN